MEEDDRWPNVLNIRHIQLLVKLKNTDTNQNGLASEKHPNTERDFAASHLRIMQNYLWPEEQLQNDGSMPRGTVYSSKHFRCRFAMLRQISERVF